MHVSGKDTDIYLGDCLDILPTLTQTAHLILTDLPYAQTANRWDVAINLSRLWDCYYRISFHNSVYVLTAIQPFAASLICSNKELFRHEWIWLKNRGSGHMNDHIMPRREHENILVFSRGGYTFNPIKEERLNKVAEKIRQRFAGKTSNWGAVQEIITETTTELRTACSYQCFSVETGLHPTQKPIAMMEYFIKTYSNPGDTVLDNCMGSGTTGIAAQNTGRKFIGIEKEKKYFNIARKELFNDRPSTEYPFPT